MNIVVAGGAGFLGSHLCRKLKQQGHDVLAYDNFSTGRTLNVQGSIRYEAGDVAVRVPSVERVFNLACPASPVAYARDPVQTLKTCFMGALNALQAAERLLHASTSEVYGDPLISPQTESYRGNVDPVGPRACYDEGKRVAETLCMEFGKQYGRTVRIARIFNTYGPYMRPDDGRVVSNFICQALRGEPLTVYGDGTQTRSFCYVDDTVDGLLKLMDSDLEGPVNIGNPQEIEVGALAEFIVRKLGGKIEYKPLPKDDPRRRCPDIRRAKSMGWEPKVGLEEGLERTIEWFRRA